MSEIVDLTALGLDMNTLIRAANNARGATGFKMSRAQIELLPILIQSNVNRRTRILRKEFMGVPIVEAE